MNLLNTPSQDKWESLGSSKRAGVLAPLFSFYSENSIGIADFSDLKLLIDWIAESGNSIIQLLPMNELGPLFCPYDSVSSFALEPAYLSLESLPFSKKTSLKKRIDHLRKSFPLPKKYVDKCIITTCELKVLERRLKRRGYPKAKIRENLDSEIFEVCKSEALERGHMVIVVNTTKGTKIGELMKSLKAEERR